MSFFCDFLKEFDIDNDDNKLKISMVYGAFICLQGKFIIDDFSDSKVVVLVQKKKFEIYGTDLKIKSVAKNELCVCGNVYGFIGEKCEQ